MKSVEQLKVALKSGEYDGVDLMQSWCTMENQQKQIAELTHALNELYEIGEIILADINLPPVMLVVLNDALYQADKVLEGN